MARTLGARIKSALAERGYFVADLAEHLGASRTAFSTRLNANRIDEPELERIGAFLELPLAFLRYGVLGSYADGWRDCAATILRAASLAAEPPAGAETAIAGTIAPRVGDELEPGPGPGVLPAEIAAVGERVAAAIASSSSPEEHASRTQSRARRVAGAR